MPKYTLLELVTLDLAGFERSVVTNAAKKTGFDGSSVKGFTPIEDSDLKLVPNSTPIPLPYEDGRAIVVCDVERRGKPYDGSPRAMLKKAMQELAEKGYRFKVAFEPEFFLLDPESLEPVDDIDYFRHVYDERVKGFLLDAVTWCRKADIQFSKFHHEVAKGQFEFNVEKADPVVACDNLVILRIALKEIAGSNGLMLTFMPKPFIGINGSGMHFHVSVYKDDRCLFEVKGGRLPREALSFIAGVLSHAKELSSVASPIVNSYKRLVPGFEAPVYLTWGFSNRSCLVRVPYYGDGPTRMEYRHPDPYGNPYLVCAAVAMAGVMGIEEDLSPPSTADFNVYHRRGEFESLPGSLGEALKVSSSSKLLRNIMGSHLEKYIDIKNREWEEYLNEAGGWEESRFKILDWEYRRYL